MDDADPHSPEAALEQLTALETISANLRPQALTRVTAFVKGHLKALIRSQAQLARDRLAVEADRQKLVEDTSTSRAIALELEKDNQLFRSENQTLIAKCNDLTQEQRKLESELSGSKSNESRLGKENDELKEKFTRTHDNLLTTLEAFGKVQQKLLDQDKSKKDATNEQIQGISAQVSQMLTMTTDRVKHLESKVEDLTARLTDARDDGMVLQLEAERFKHKLRDYRENEATHKSNMKTLETYARDLEDQLKKAPSARSKIAEKPKKMPEAREKDVEAARGTADSHKTESERLKGELKTAQTRLQAAQDTSHATQIRLDEEHKRLQEANKQLKEVQSRLGEEQEKLRAANEELDDKRAKLHRLQSPGPSTDNPRKRRRSRSPERGPPIRQFWGSAPQRLWRNLNMLNLDQDTEEGYPPHNDVFFAVASILCAEGSTERLKEFIEYSELEKSYCFTGALHTKVGQKANAFTETDDKCSFHKDSDDSCLPVYVWVCEGEKTFTFEEL
ncbi:hypothetical protein N0V92_011229 [Colletotrichum tropicale]|nr:hypothetical protein N0V92_011229 [Colletotrichum tropicale]